MSIKVQHVTKLYGQQKALDDVSFEIGKGEVVGFLGPNGAGKSTMMKIISCYLTPSSGSVEVCGHSIDEDSIKVRSLIGYLPENNPLYTDMYIKEYLQFVCGLYGLKDVAERLSELIKITGLELEQHKKIGQLSKGYKQRVGIAQALIHDPKVLILDEPTSGLDPNQLVGIRKLIRDLGKEKTIMFSSHIMQEVEAVSDRIIIINKGKLVTDQKAAGLTEASGKRQTVVVEVDRPVAIEKLKSINGIKEAEEIQENTYRLISDTKSDIRKTISKWAQEHDLLILSMNREDQRLEDVFQKLTSKN